MKKNRLNFELGAMATVAIVLAWADWVWPALVFAFLCGLDFALAIASRRMLDGAAIVKDLHQELIYERGKSGDRRGQSVGQG